MFAHKLQHFRNRDEKRIHPFASVDYEHNTILRYIKIIIPHAVIHFKN
ncbi:hypothetical protein ELI_0573 [Eubacterium callanderi]|uniref:Uncharacterized protein n=1 Tax=Eubacterium callanderi TaxID=53442 RepID=E3GIV4_9FIRM|nr:hypothetical protein ELI_0573 [Eubacterium callanderi]